MIKALSNITQKYPLLSLIGLGVILNAYIQGMSQHINGLEDPLQRQFYQNLFICLLCALVAIAAGTFLVMCQNVHRNHGIHDGDAKVKNPLFTVIVPVLMVVILVGDIAVVASLRW